MARDNCRRTALHLAALSGVSTNIEVLLEAGADVNAKTTSRPRAWLNKYVQAQKNGG